MNILLIDDSRAVHSLVGEMLDGCGVTFIHAYNGAEAVRMVSDRNFPGVDLVLLDWEMPELSGIDALPQLRAKHPDLPIVMMTSKNAMSDITMALERGASDYMMKPFTRDILTGKLSMLLGREVA